MKKHRREHPFQGGDKNFTGVWQNGQTFGRFIVSTTWYFRQMGQKGKHLPRLQLTHNIQPQQETAQIANVFVYITKKPP